MEWGVRAYRVAVIALHKSGKSDFQIFELLKPLKISRKCVYRAVKPYKELWGVEDRARSGRPRCVRTKTAMKTVQKRVRRNPLQKQNSLSREKNISPRLMSRLVRDDLHTTACRRSKGHLHTLTLKEIRQTRTEHLLQWQAENGHENNLFTGEKIFTIEEQYNQQKDNIYAQTSHEVKENVLRVQGGHHFSYIMVWWEVSHQGMTHLHFCKKVVKLVSKCIKRTCYKKL
jgi:hypothetical protein